MSDTAPGIVTTVKIAATVRGLMSSAIGALAFMDANNHGNETGAVAGMSILIVGLLVLIMCVGLWANDNWGRVGAVCAETLALAVGGFFATRYDAFAVSFGLAAVVALVFIVLLLLPDVKDWYEYG